MVNIVTTFEKLKAKIFKDTGIKLEGFRRTYAGINMKGSGAFVWTAYIEGTNMDVGSGDSASELLKVDKIGIVNELDMYSQPIEFS